MLIKNDYVLMEEEWDVYHNFKSSLLQKIVWFFFPSITSIKVKLYKDVEREDCI